MRVVAFLAVCALPLVVRADEEPATRQQRLENVAASERRGEKPWAVEYSLTYTDHEEAERKETRSSSKRDARGSGGGRMTFFAESDYTATQFQIDGNGTTWKENNGKGSYQESTESKDYVDLCKASSETRTTLTGSNLDCKVFFEIQDDPKVWRLSVGCDGDGQRTTKTDRIAPRVKDTPDPDWAAKVKAGGPVPCDRKTASDSSKTNATVGGECVNDTPGAKLVRDANGLTVDCTITTSHAGTNGTDKVTGERKVMMHARIDFKPETKYYATLEPANDGDYKTWRPEGPKLDGGSVKNKDGNKLAVRLRLRDAATKQEINKPYSATITLASSRVPGVAMNYPPQKEANTDWDLYFRQDDNKGHVAGKDGQMLVVDKVTGATDISITSRDWGGYATLGAVVNVEGKAVPVKAIAFGKETDSLAVPRDEDRNHVADGWEDDQGILGKGYPATWDEEDTPTLHNKGDGYSLYDEYRGFYLQDSTASNRAARSERVELSPKQRDILIAVEGEPQARGYAGAKTFAKITGLALHFVANRAHLAKHGGDDKSGRFPRLSNFNRSSTDKLDEEQAAVWVSFSDRGDCGITPPVGGIDVMSFGSPMYVQGAFVAPHRCETEVNNQIDFGKWHVDPKYGSTKAMRIQAAYKKRGLSESAFESQAASQASKTSQRLIEFSVVHELGHAFGARHHQVDMVVHCGGDCSDAVCDAPCVPFTETSHRSQSCSVAYTTTKPEKEVSVADTEPHIGDDVFRKKHRWECYDGMAERYGGGDDACPMRYWQFLDGEAMVKFLLGEWDPAAGNPKGGGWSFCAENGPTMRLRQDASELLTP